jgi:RNA polymerase sigma-70 factor (ECF subfamily)
MRSGAVMKARGVPFERGRAAYPRLDLRPEVFERFVARAVEGTPEVDRVKLPIEDLYLACACAEDVPGAAVAFEEKLGRIVRRAVARVLPLASEREEAAQRTRYHLLVRSEDGPPKIANYRGEGPLASWVSVAAIRLAVSMGRAATSDRKLSAKAAGEAAGVDPELLLMKRELRQEFEAAVEAALAGLADRERLVLRFYLVSGMTLAGIGKTFGVTQQTVSRWLEKARTDVLAEVQRRLGERLKLPSGEMTSVARLVASRLDISISRLLGAA